jgi:SulP family sulfate permease
MLAFVLRRQDIGGSTQAAGAECLGANFADLLLRPLEILRSVRREHLTPDLIAGLTVAAVAVPQAIAYASIAELPAHYGLYTAAIAAIVGSLWGCSRFLATGPVNASSLLVLPVLLAVASPGSSDYLLAASLVAVMAGILGVVLAFLRFGALVTLASRSVLIGFTAGAAIHIAIGQVKHLLRLDVPAMPELYRTVSAIFDRAAASHGYSLTLGLGALALLIIFRRFGRRFPAALLAIAASAIAVWAFDLDGRGVVVVGAIPRALPPPTWITTGTLPDFGLIRSLLVGSMAVAALGLIEATAASQTLARRSGERLNSNQEFFGQGLANIASGLFSGYPCSGSFTRSALAQQAGARTHLTGVITGLTILCAMLAFAPLVGLVPRPAIAGVLLAVAWGMLDRQGIRRVLRTSRAESAIMIITFCATLVLPLDFAILSGIVFSLAFFVIRSSLPRVFSVVPDRTFRHFADSPEAPVCPQLGVMDIRGPLFFGAVYHIEEELRHNHEKHPGQNILALRMQGVDICDLSGIEMLESTVKTYRQFGGDVYLIRPRRPVLEKIEQSGLLDDVLGRDHVLESENAIEFLFNEVLDPVICAYECEHRVFAECQTVAKHPYGVQFPPAPKHTLPPGRHLHPREFRDMAHDGGSVIFDLREPVEYDGGHIAGSTLLPLRTLPERAAALPRDRKLLLVSRSGRRSARAIHMLEDLGFTKIWGLRGGILAWRAAGLPVTAAVRSNPSSGRS